MSKKYKPKARKSNSPSHKKKHKEEEIKPLQYTLSDRFIKDYKKLPNDDKVDIDRTLKIIDEQGTFTPGMRVKKLQGLDQWYIRTSWGARITFDYLQDNIMYLRKCGPHKIID